MTIFLFPIAYNASSKDVFYEYFSASGDATFCYVVSQDKMGDTSLSTENRVVKCGLYSFIYFENESIKEHNIAYKQVEIKNIDVEKICKDLSISIFKIEQFPYKIVYGYTSLFPDYIYFSGYKMNAQIVLKDDCVIVGCPAIYTGF